MKIIHKIAFVLLVIGGLNWLLVALNYNAVEAIFGAGTVATMVVYILVGLSAIWVVATHKKDCKMCNKMS